MKDSFKELTFPELLAKREELRRQYEEVSFKGIIGHLDNPLSKRTVRRRLARVHCLIREHELGIRRREGAAREPGERAAREPAKGA